MIVFLIVFTAAVFSLAAYMKKFMNPFRLYMIFGKKGSGKTTLLVKLALDYKKKGWTVYSTVDIPGIRRFRAEDIGEYVFPDHSVVFCDEVGIIWDNRNYKNFKAEVRDYFKFQRQYRNIVYLFSQTFDIDLKLRNLTDGMYLCRCYGGILSVARKISRSIVLTKASGSDESRIADDLQFEPAVMFLFGGQPMLFTWIPFYIRYFQSFDPPERPYIPYELLPELDVTTAVQKVQKYFTCMAESYNQFILTSWGLYINLLLCDNGEVKNM